MRDEDRARAAKAFLANPLMNELFAALRQSRVDQLLTTDLPNAAERENCFLAVRALDEMRGQLEVWARETERKGA